MNSRQPKVLIAMASGILGGPGKGLVQFLKNGGSQACYPVVINYKLPHEREDTEFVLKMRSAGAIVEDIVQKKTFDFSMVEQSLALIKKYNINILQSHGYKSHILCWMLHRKTRLPWVAFVHGWTSEDFKIRVYNFIDKTMPLFADEVIAVSESLRSRLLPSLRRRCRVIPNAVAPDELADDPARDVRAELGIPRDALVAGVIGRFSPEKGQLVFIRALAKAREKEPRLHGLLVGDGQDKPLLEKEITKYKLNNNIFFTGHVRGLGAYYRAIDIQVMPSFSEGMPNAALEGMYMSLPLIASKVGGVPEVVLDNDTGLLLPAGDTEALAVAMLKLCADSELRASMGLAGKTRVMEHFLPDVRVNRILEVYSRILQKN